MDLFRTSCISSHGVCLRPDSDAHLVFCVTLPISYAAGNEHSARLSRVGRIRRNESELIRKVR